MQATTTVHPIRNRSIQGQIRIEKQQCNVMLVNTVKGPDMTLYVNFKIKTIFPFGTIVKSYENGCILDDERLILCGNIG